MATGRSGHSQDGVAATATASPPAHVPPSSERYLRGHPETRLLLRGFLRELLLRRPADVLEFAAGYFTQPELPGRIQAELGGEQGGSHSNNRQ